MHLAMHSTRNTSVVGCLLYHLILLFFCVPVVEAQISPCTITNGSSANSVQANLNQFSCQCGTTVCNFFLTGMFCFASSNRCAKGPVCSNIDGSAVNTGTCVCGSSECDSSSGLFCRAAENECAKSSNSFTCTNRDAT